MKGINVFGYRNFTLDQGIHNKRISIYTWTLCYSHLIRASRSNIPLSACLLRTTNVRGSYFQWMVKFMRRSIRLCVFRLGHGLLPLVEHVTVHGECVPCSLPFPFSRLKHKHQKRTKVEVEQNFVQRETKRTKLSCMHLAVSSPAGSFQKKKLSCI